MAERVGGLSVIIIRQAGKSGSLYGSVSARDISDAATAGGLSINRAQVVLDPRCAKATVGRRTPSS